MAGSARVRALSPRTPELLGARIRKARLAAGLSLAAVAQTDFSRAYLNQIELGRARPSTRILQIISERLRRPIEYFLQDPQNSILAVEFVLTEARTRLRQGDAAGVQTMVTGLLARPHLPLEVKCRARLSLAEALLNLRSIPEAIDLLRATIRDTETNGWRILTVELYDKMGSAYYLRRQPHDAGRWWDNAWSLYEDANVNDPVLKARILGHRANVHYVAGQPREAIAGYEAAIEAAEAVLDMKQLGGIYEGLAMAFDRAGDLTRALEYAQRSLRLFETLNDVRMSAQLRNNMAEILLHQGQPIEAEALFLTGAEQLQRVGDKWSVYVIDLLGQGTKRFTELHRSIDGITVPGFENFSYSAAKAGLHHLTKHMASALAPSILVNAIAPGPFPTKMMEVPLAEHGDEIRERNPLHRIGSPDDAAALAIFLSSRGSAFITGATIPLDGGMTTTVKAV